MDASAFVIKHFILNKIHSLVFKNDDKQAEKLQGIEPAIKDGWFRTLSNTDNSIQVIATNKLTNLYNFEAMRTKKDFINYGKKCRVNNNYAAIIYVNGDWQKKAFEFGYNCL